MVLGAALIAVIGAARLVRGQQGLRSATTTEARERAESARAGGVLTLAVAGFLLCAAGAIAVAR